jgi:hypothetical protein
MYGGIANKCRSTDQDCVVTYVPCTTFGGAMQCVQNNEQVAVAGANITSCLTNKAGTTCTEGVGSSRIDNYHCAWSSESNTCGQGMVYDTTLNASTCTPNCS